MSFPANQRLWYVVTVLLVCLCLSACGGNKRVTKENAAKIKEGMTVLDVEGILGKGDSDGGLSLAEGSSGAGAAGIGGDLSSVSRPASGTQWMKWGDDNKYIKIGFDGGKVGKGKIEQKGL